MITVALRGRLGGVKRSAKIQLGLVGGGALALSLLLLRRRPWAVSYPSKYRSDDLSALLPTFRSKVEQLLWNMRARGFQPVVVDALRTPAEAQANEDRGTGKADSLHIYGAAVDIVDAQRGRNHPEFFAALGQEAAELGLTWGGNWTTRDIAHVQAVPVSVESQLRALKTVVERDLLVQRFAA